MIVELIGCDGSGKTTLSRMLRDGESPDDNVVAIADLVLGRPGLRRISHPTARNLTQELAGLPYLVRALRRRRAYLGFAWRMHVRYAPSRFDRWNGMRGIARRIGMYELATGVASDRTVLSDEGTVLSAYLFALSDVELDPAHLERFAELVPRPDRIVYVRSSQDALVRRAMERPDRRRQHRRRSRAEIERTIRRTVDVFDHLVETAPLRDRVLVVDNEDGEPEAVRRSAAELARELRASLAPGVAAPPGDGLHAQSRA